MLRTANPALSNKTFTEFANLASKTQSMTLQATVNKTFILLFCILFSASYTWGLFFEAGNPAAVTKWMIIGVIGGLISFFVTIFKKDKAAVTTPIYALCQGLFLGGLSATLEYQYPGIVIQAVGLTFGTLFALLAAYKSRLIKATENFKLGVVAATGSIALFYFASFILGFFGVSIPLLNSSGPMGIIFSLVVVVVAALNLVLDFDFIEKGSEMNAPKYMEWIGAFGLIVTLIWLYIEILRLLVKLRSQNR